MESSNIYVVEELYLVDLVCGLVDSPLDSFLGHGLWIMECFMICLWSSSARKQVSG